MGPRAVDHGFSAIVGGVLAVLAAGGFAYLFLGTTPVEEVTNLYWSLHLDAVMEVDTLFGIGHVLAYAAITFVLACRTPSAFGWLRILVSLTLIGFAVECAQGFVDGRGFNLEDVFVNFCGILLGFFLVVLAGPRVVRRPLVSRPARTAPIPTRWYPAASRSRRR